MTVTATVAATSFTTFAATNIDDIFLLTLFFARRIPTRRIVLGQLLGFTVIVALSCVGSTMALAIPIHWVHLLGLMPLALGIRGLFRLGRATDAPLPASDEQSTLGIAAVTLANGADNLGVYIPFFHFNREHLWLVLSVYGALLAVWCIAAKWLGQHTVVLKVLDRTGRWLVPVVFIGLGVYILKF